MICFSGEGLLSIKTSDFPTHQQRMPGVVVGFRGSEIFSLNYTTLSKVRTVHGHGLTHSRGRKALLCAHLWASPPTTRAQVDVPLAATLYHYMEKRQFPAAYRIASLSATASDWKNLASAALLALDTEVARKAFMRLRDHRGIDLCAIIDKQRKGNAAKAKFGAVARQASGKNQGSALLNVATQVRECLPHPLCSTRYATPPTNVTA